MDQGEHFHLYLETEDAAAAAQALTRNGVPMVQPVHVTPWGTQQFVIRNDQGRTLDFGERR